MTDGNDDLIGRLRAAMAKTSPRSRWREVSHSDLSEAADALERLPVREGEGAEKAELARGIEDAYRAFNTIAQTRRVSGPVATLALNQAHHMKHLSGILAALQVGGDSPSRAQMSQRETAPQTAEGPGKSGCIVSARAEAAFASWEQSAGWVLKSATDREGSIRAFSAGWIACEDAQSSARETAPPAAEVAGKWRKRPVVIDAFQFTNRVCEDRRPPWLLAAVEAGVVAYHDVRNGPGYLTIKTLEGDMRANEADWIIRGVRGEIYPCKPDIFAATYEPADSTATSNRPADPDSQAPSGPQGHTWVPSRLGHGEQMCSKCFGTNRELAAIGELGHCTAPTNSAPVLMVPASAQGQSEGWAPTETAPRRSRWEFLIWDGEHYAVAHWKSGAWWSEGRCLGEADFALWREISGAPNDDERPPEMDWHILTPETDTGKPDVLMALAPANGRRSWRYAVGSQGGGLLWDWPYGERPTHYCMIKNPPLVKGEAVTAQENGPSVDESTATASGPDTQHSAGKEG